MAIDLLEFQRGLWARLQSARTTDTADTRLGIATGGERWLLSLAEADSVLPLRQIAAIPAVQPWYCGLVNVRGNLYGVIDFAIFRGGEATLRNMNTRIIVVAQRFKVNAAMLVEQMLGLQNLKKFKPGSMPADAPTWLRAVYVDESGEVWRELNLAALTSNSRFMQISELSTQN